MRYPLCEDLEPAALSSVPAHELFQTLMAAIGYLEGNLVHAYSAAFHRVPRLHETLAPDEFLRSAEIREVVDAVIQLLRVRSGIGQAGHRRELQLCATLERMRDDWLRP